MNRVFIFLLLFSVAATWVGYGFWLGRGWLDRYKETYVQRASVELGDLFWVASGLEIFYLGVILAAAMSALFWFLTGGSLPVSGLAALGGFLMPLGFLRHMKARRLAKFESQLVDGLALLASSLRAGLNLSQAVDKVASNTTPPLASEFRVMSQERRLGRSEDEAFENLAGRVPSEDLGLMVTAILTTRRSGGNMAEVFDTIATTVRERIRINEKVKSLTAQARGEATVLAFMPPVLGGLFWLIDPTLIRPLFSTTAGNYLLGFILVWETIGYFFMRWLGKVDI